MYIYIHVYVYIYIYIPPSHLGDTPITAWGPGGGIPGLPPTHSTSAWGGGPVSMCLGVSRDYSIYTIYTIYSIHCILLYIHIHICIHTHRSFIPIYIMSVVVVFKLLNKKQNNNKFIIACFCWLACNADSGLLLALSAPRGAFLADFQAAGASGRSNGGHLEEAKNTQNTQCSFQAMAHTARVGSVSFEMFFSFWIISKKWFPRLSSLLK